ncbi:MAG: hypothetical protein AUF76_15670 [Acidobacteria bacterium 13_1_20CM_2_65_9]|nr:MAG: hypothetical protein AUF76_15670 [Acidobacteria bacterium 13_1_20CM_2_65_9]
MDVDTLRYPVGPMPRTKTPLDRATREQHLATIEQLPSRIKSLVAGLSDAQLDTRYRPGGWTIRQVAAVKTYEESLWADLPEAKSGAIQMSLDLLDALHRRWMAFLRALPERDFNKAFMHPEWGRVPLDEAIGMYAWHCRHHAAHIENALAAARA